ncbi:hypothetical protein D3C72_1419910 [compost metagenome]
MSGLHPHGFGNILHAFDAGHLVPGHDIRQQQRIAHAMSDVEAPAQRIRQRMHRADPGVAERHAGHQAGGGHVFAGLQVGAIGVGLGQRFGDQLDGAKGQRVGDRRGIHRQIGLDGVHQRVDATGGGDTAWAGQGHLRADQRHVRQ